jgi:raffinose/stachyose/melibiose transport system permease protein
MSNMSIKSERVGKRKRDSLLAHIMLIFVATLQLAPLLIMVFNSFRLDTAIKKYPVMIPESLHYQNYIDAWQKGMYTSAYLNTIIIGVVVVFGVLFLGGLAAYGMAKLELPHRELYIGYFTVAMAIPGFLALVPTYFMMSKLGLTNSKIGVICVYIAMFMPLQTMMIRTYLVGIPRELEEAGKIDGCSEIGVFYHITLALARPIITTVALLVFVNCWNEFMWSNTLLVAMESKTVASRFYNFTTEHSSDAAMIYTAGVIMMAPIAVLYLTLQDTFIEGLTAGGLKG